MLTVDGTAGLSLELSNTFGVMGEFQGTFGTTSKFIGGLDTGISQIHLMAGLFYYQPSFRIFSLGGLGVGKDIFGYPNAIEELQNDRSISHNNLTTSSLGVTLRGSIGADYQLSKSLLLSAQYNYTRSKTTVSLENSETFYISNHTFAVMIGLGI